MEAFLNELLWESGFFTVDGLDDICHGGGMESRVANDRVRPKLKFHGRSAPTDHVSRATPPFPTIGEQFGMVRELFPARNTPKWRQ